MQVIETKAWNDSVPCMKSFGFELPLRSAGVQQQSIPYELPAGLGSCIRFSYSNARPPVEGPDPMTDPGFAEALVGKAPVVDLTFTLPSGNPGVARVESGCLGAAKSALGGTVEKYALFLQAGALLREQAALARMGAIAGETFVQLDGAWSKCMSLAGFDY